MLLKPLILVEKRQLQPREAIMKCGFRVAMGNDGVNRPDTDPLIFHMNTFAGLSVP